MNGDELEYIGRDLVKFGDRSYRWIDIKRFALATQPQTPAKALDLLLRHVRYRDHYTSADSQDRDSETLHGPYKLDHIMTASFEPLDAEQAVNAGSDFVSLHGGTTEETRATLDQVVFPLVREMSVWFRLPDVGATAHHDFGWVLTDFMELVLIDIPSRRLVLLVAGQTERPHLEEMERDRLPASGPRDDPLNRARFG
jgi:hypothetical protein